MQRLCVEPGLLPVIHIQLVKLFACISMTCFLKTREPFLLAEQIYTKSGFRFTWATWGEGKA